MKHFIAVGLKVAILLAQILMMYYESAPKIMPFSEKLRFIGQSDAFLWLVYLV